MDSNHIPARSTDDKKNERPEEAAHNNTRRNDNPTTTEKQPSGIRSATMMLYHVVGGERIQAMQVRDRHTGELRDPNGNDVATLIEALQRYAATLPEAV